MFNGKILYNPQGLRRASLRVRLLFLRTGRIPNYWARASQDVFLTFINMLSADTAAADSFFAGRSKEERNAVLDFLFTARMPYSKVKKYLHRIHDGDFSPTDTIGTDGNRPDYF